MFFFPPQTLEPVLKNNTCLTTLDLECNSIESEGAAAIGKFDIVLCMNGSCAHAVIYLYT